MKMHITTDVVVLKRRDSNINIQSYIHLKKNFETNDEGQVKKKKIINDITPESNVLPVPPFPEIIKKLPEDQVHITVDEQYKTTIKSGKALFTLYGQSTSEYPQVEIHQHD